MAECRFPILGGVVPPMLGREAIVQRLLRSLTKSTPDHLQVVGPRFAGKTVILHELARQLREKGTPYSAVLLWDLGHQTPATDELFMRRLAQELAAALAPKHPEYAKHLNSVQEQPYQDIAEVIELLSGEGKVLVILDGFDKPLSNGQLTRNLWDQLRELASKPSLRFVTASRRKLSELIRHPDAQTSDFWNIFAPSPIRVGCFDEDDIEAVLEQLDGITLAGGARTELLNESNGFPVLLLAVLNILQEDVSVGEVKPNDVVQACSRTVSEISDVIEMLWTECSPSSQDLLLRVLEENRVSSTGTANVDVEALIERGFLRQAGNKLEQPCRLLRRFLETRPHEGNAMVRLFGSSQAYHQNFRSVMERRLAQLSGIDPTLKRYLERSADDLPAHPEIFMSNVHGILERSLALIWEAELNGLTIPEEWFSVWRRNGERGFEDWQSSFPEGGPRLRLLHFMTGTQKSNRCSKYITKPTYVLINGVQGFRDFGVHPKSSNIDLGTAYAAFMLCIELAASLTRELPPT